MKYLTEPSEEDLQMIDPSKVYFNKKAIPKVNGKAAALAALAGNRDNRK